MTTYGFCTKSFCMITIVLISLVLASCGTKLTDKTGARTKITLTKTSFTHLPGWRKDHQSQAAVALQKSCKIILSERNQKKPVGTNNIAGTRADWKPACQELAQLQITNISARKFFEQYFTPFQVTAGSEKQGLFTGYYELSLFGHTKRNGKYVHPIYSPPPNLKKMKHGLSRSNINKGKLEGLGLELLYVNDPVALFFLHIQGSGRVHLANGQVIKVGYAGQNGHAYCAIGKYIKENARNYRRVSAATLMGWLQAQHPHHAHHIMDQNQSYVFFKLIDGDSPIGAQGVALTPERSLAVDPRFIPLGVPVWLDTFYPKKSKLGQHPFQKLLIAQDVGGAIKGAIRGDIFFGHGRRAESLAFGMSRNGSYYILLPKTLRRYQNGQRFGPY
jgi:membrane-bound lytic murein transglycosylase A